MRGLALADTALSTHLASLGASVPILTFHLVEGHHCLDDIRALISACCRDYAEVLGSPMERVRSFVRLHNPELTFVAGSFVDDEPRAAPFFEFIVLSGRTYEQRARLLQIFTDHLVEHLSASRELVRGRAVEVDPSDWAIGGTPAAQVRAGEVSARAASK